MGQPKHPGDLAVPHNVLRVGLATVWGAPYAWLSVAPIGPRRCRESSPRAWQSRVDVKRQGIVRPSCAAGGMAGARKARFLVRSRRSSGFRK